MMVSLSGLKGELHHHHSLAKLTTWRVGGEADTFYRPESIDDLSVFLAQWPEEEAVTFLGLGSNLLIRDGGVRGAVVLLLGMDAQVEVLGGGKVRASAGVPCAKVARFVAHENLAGGAFFAGIPGTIGGALAMNAGAFGGETWERVLCVETLDRQGCKRVRDKTEFDIGYRSVKGIGHEVFVAATFEFEKGDAGTEKLGIKALLAKRAQTQPTGIPSCGSVFRNPEGDHAARLIEAAGLKGKTIGGAEVSSKHANFILNTNGATAADIEALILWVQETVEQDSGVCLYREVRILGDAL